jgi:hypothetical protein
MYQTPPCPTGSGEMHLWLRCNALIILQILIILDRGAAGGARGGGVDEGGWGEGGVECGFPRCGVGSGDVVCGGGVDVCHFLWVWMGERVVMVRL